MVWILFWFHRNFQRFDAAPGTDPSQIDPSTQAYAGSFYDPTPAYGGGIYNPQDNHQYYGGENGGGANEFDDEPPLLEELGINPNHIMQKVSTLSIYFGTITRDRVEKSFFFIRSYISSQI